MSPYPAKTDQTEILGVARALIEREGFEALSLSKVAAEIGIKSPSLYRHFANKSALTKAVIAQTLQELFEAYELAMSDRKDPPFERLIRLFHVHRDFAHANPNAYILAYTTTDPALRVDADELERQAIIVQEIMAEISGKARSLPALRGALALVHGFVMLELKDQLQRGGDLTDAFDQSIRAYLRGWKS